MKKILILNGSPRLNGNTSALIEEFTKGAKLNENENEIIKFDLDRMNIHCCKGCLKGGKNPDSPCSQKDDMDKIYPYYKEADIVVLASPMYYWAFSSQLKMVIDRLFAVTEIDPNYKTPYKECFMLMAAEGNDEKIMIRVTEKNKAVSIGTDTAFSFTVNDDCTLSVVEEDSGLENIYAEAQ